MTRKFSALLFATLFAVACATSNPDDANQNQKAKRGAGIGAAAGAVAGAIIGNQTGNPRTGAVVGAAIGTAVGAAVGHRMDQQQKELQQIPGVEVTRPAENEIAVQLTNDILFDFNSAALRTESQQTLRDLAANFRRYADESITVEGHTDNVGSPEYNQGLSERRADAVKKYLIDHGAAANDQITAKGFGKSNPIGDNKTRKGQFENRRAEILIFCQ